MAVFVMHPDLDVLGAIVERLRGRGIETVHAAEVSPLLQRAGKERPSLLVVPANADNLGLATELATLRAAFVGVPEVSIPSIGAVHDADTAHILEEVTGALAAAAMRPHSTMPGAGGEVRGDLAQVPLPDLLQLLSMGRKTGTLTITTSSAAGELRLSEGEVVDAMFRRAEGMKAVVRLLGERDGAFHFAPDAAPALRRMTEPISSILMEGTRQTDEIRRQREHLGLHGAAQSMALHVADVRLSDTMNEVARQVARVLSTPCMLDDLLDALPVPDLDILLALGQLDETGALRRLPVGELRPSLAGPEGMVVLRGLARRLRPRGYRHPGRLVLVGSADSVRLARQAVSRLAEAVPGADASTELSSDRMIEATATLQLGESVALELITVVDRADIVPALPMVLSGAIGVLALDRPSAALVEMLEELEVALVDARSVGMELDDRPLDPGDPTCVAAIIRGAIEGMGGS